MDGATKFVKGDIIAGIIITIINIVAGLIIGIVSKDAFRRSNAKVYFINCW